MLLLESINFIPMYLLEHAPGFNDEAAAAVADKLYGIRGRVTSLPSERDQNFLIASESGEKFVLKIANALEDRVFLEAQNQAMSHLEKRLSFCPRIVPTLSGELMSQAETSIESPHQSTNILRLVSYLPGVPLGDVKPQTAEILHDLGKKLGQLDRELVEFDHPALHRDFHWDLANGLTVISKYGRLVADTRLRELVYRYAQEFERGISPLLPRLRRSVIHGDANDYNVIVTNGAVNPAQCAVIGLIDFGDMVWSFTVGDLAVTIAYVVLGKTDPLSAAAHVVAGYTSELPLKEDEIEVLYGLALMRLCMSVCLSAYQQKQRPENEYLKISQASIRNSLPRLMEIDSSVAADAFRVAASNCADEP
jgi:Ser/Thr protein kinase RdoA (MazF antagonist)